MGVLLLPVTLPAVAPPARSEDHDWRLARHGRELFLRDWRVDDSRCHGGDGLGPLYNAASCVICHGLGGPGGAWPASTNVDLLNLAKFDTTTLSLGSSGQAQAAQARQAAARLRTRSLTFDRDSVIERLHPGLRESASLVLHHFASDPNYGARHDLLLMLKGTAPLAQGLPEIVVSPELEEKALLSHLQSSRLAAVTQRNPTPVFGVGHIDAIPDEAIHAADRGRRAGVEWAARAGPPAQGRSGRQVRLEVADRLAPGVRAHGLRERAGPGEPRPSSGHEPVEFRLGGPDPRPHRRRVRRLDGLRPRPSQSRRARPGPGRLGLGHGCAGGLRIRRMRGVPPTVARRGRRDLRRPPAPRHGPEPERLRAVLRRRRLGLLRRPREQRVADAYALGPPRVGPYLHDGRAAILADAIGKHGGEAHDTVRRYSALSVVQKFQLDTFLKTLTAPARPAELASRSLVARREWAADYDRTEAEDRALRSERLAAAERARKLAEQLQIEKE